MFQDYLWLLLRILEVHGNLKQEVYTQERLGVIISSHKESREIYSSKGEFVRICIINIKLLTISKKFKSAEVPWWVVLKNASWFNPEGVDSNIYQR